MKIHEYQGKDLFRGFGVPTPRGIACFSVDEAVAAADKLGGPVWVVKAQIHAGGRGKGKFIEVEAGEDGGVRIARSADEAAENARPMLGRTLDNHPAAPQPRMSQAKTGKSSPRWSPARCQAFHVCLSSPSTPPTARIRITGAKCTMRSIGVSSATSLSRSVTSGT